MYNCELYSVLGSEQDVSAFNSKLDDIASALYEKDIRVMYNTEIANDQKAITKALKEADKNENAPDYYIFVNALDTTDALSFKQLFHNYIREQEKLITSHDENEGKVGKYKISTLYDLGEGYPGYCFSISGKRYIVLPQASLTQNEISFLINKAVDKAQEIFEKNDEDNIDGIAYIDAPKKRKKEGFFSSFIPKKTDSKNTKIRKWIVIVAIIIFLIAAGYLINKFIIQPYLNAQITAEIYDIAYDSDVDDDGDKNGRKQNWDKLKKINKEIVGWITLDKTKIDYPVLEHKGDNAYSQYYLNHTYKKTYSPHGSIFVDYRCTKSVKSKNVILHGHNMPDGSMFRALMGYGDLKGDLEYYKKHPIIEFNTPKEDAQYKIISVFKTNTYYFHDNDIFFNYMQANFLSDAEFMNYVYNVRVRSLIDCPVMVNEDDTLLTLSTCSYEYSGFRTVVVARKVREGEKAKVNTEIATLNDNPLFPAVYYNSRGQEKPKELTFKQANKKGLITWYDGEGKLEGSEVLTATAEANPTEPPTEKPKKKDKNNSASSQKLVNYYEVKFVNWDGTEYYTVTAREGDSVTPPSGTPGLPSDQYYNYKFTGWDTDGLNLDSVQYSMTIYPKFKATKK